MNFREAFPRALSDEVDAVVAALPPPAHEPGRDPIGAITIRGEAIVIPFRIYRDPMPEQSTALRRRIAN